MLGTHETPQAAISSSGPFRVHTSYRRPQRQPVSWRRPYIGQLQLVPVHQQLTPTTAITTRSPSELNIQILMDFGATRECIRTLEATGGTSICPLLLFEGVALLKSHFSIFTTEYWISYRLDPLVWGQ